MSERLVGSLLAAAGGGLVGMGLSTDGDAGIRMMLCGLTALIIWAAKP